MTYYEIKNIFSKKGNRLALVFLLAVVVVILYFIMGENGYVNENGDEITGFRAIAKKREVQKEWAGELTEEKIRKVIEENVRISQTPEALSRDYRQNDIAYSQKQGFMDIRTLLNCSYGGFNEYDYYLTDSLPPEAASDFYSNRIKNLEEWLNTDGKDQFSKKEKEYLLENYKDLKTPFYYDYQAGWKFLFQYAPTVVMIVTLILSFFCAGIFSGEFQQKSNAVFYASFYGRNRAVTAKIKAGLITITGIYWSTVLLYTGLVLGLLGADGAGCPIQSSMAGWKSIYHITNLQEYLLIVIGGYLGCLFMLALTMLVSAMTNSAFVAVAIPFILIFLPSFLSGINSNILSKILGLFPDQLLQMSQAVKFFNLYQIGGCVFLPVPILLAGYLILTVVILPVIYVIYRKKQAY